MVGQHKKRVVWVTAAAALILIAVASTASAQAVIKVNDQVNFKFGLLLQPQGNWAEDAVAGGYSQNVFARRMRILVGGQLSPKISFFAETDAPNEGRVMGGVKQTSSMFIQDAFMTYKFSDRAMIDAGLMLPSTNRNGLQSAASLLPLDYGAYTFANNGPTSSIVGRDTGAQLRGYLAKNHFEYRVGVYQGLRDKTSHNALRTNMRVAYNFFDTETGFFYTGTNLGKKRQLAIGGGYEQQKEYKNVGADIFFDQPVGKSKNAVTIQGDFVRFDGGKFMASLPRQTDTLLEFGYYISAAKISPVLQYAKRDRNGTAGDETRTGVGVNFWPAGHNTNFKILYTTIKPRGGSSLSDISVQLQFFYF